MTIYFNALHAPIGAHASFTLGCTGQKGGLGLEMGWPVNENVFIGVETKAGGRYETLPCYAGSENAAAQFDHAAESKKEKALFGPFAQNAIRRDYRLGSDAWMAGDLVFTIFSPVESAPDPAKTSRAAQQAVYCPSVIAEMTIDNRKGRRTRRAFFGYSGGGSTDSMRWFDGPGLTGVAKGQRTGIFCDDVSVRSAQGFNVEGILQEKHEQNHKEGLGGTGLLLLSVPAGQRKTFRFAICFYRGGIVTTGMPTRYWYTRFFADLEAVGRYSLRHFAGIRRRALASERLIASRKLNDAQRFQMIHAIRSYYGSTQLLEYRGKPVWIVNEGQYRMMNTFDLTVDQVFYEMKLNPWTVRNELDLFAARYSYADRLHFPGGKNEQPGGLSFTHDMGCCNHFSWPGHSTYERFGLTGCFSHMTHEQLVNWILCAAVYYRGTGDRRWMRSKLPVLKKCLASMLNRDHPVDRERNGVMGLDSDRTLDGAEITTYDSLDVSLGQARNNLYIALKGWASYLAMETIFAELACPREAARAARQARRAADTMASHLNDEGYIPAILGEPCDARIIPAIEGLVFPWVLNQREFLTGRGPYGALIKALKTHFATVFRKGVCIYPDNGWKLSSTADNSWLSKIYLCQFVARKILGVKTPATGMDADEAHRAWLLKSENLYFAWSDQMRSGVAMGSKYYPRGVTSILWLRE